MSLMRWLAGTTVLQSILWTFLVPLWHFPDEQAHFAHVAFIAEGGDLTRHGRDPDMNEEIYTSLEILGTKRDGFGNNKFTFHPEYRLPYSDTLFGPEEETINNLPQSSRTNFVIRESAYYPHLYYQVSAIIYKLFYNQNLFVRVFSVRLFWLLAHWLTLYLIYLIAKEVFKNRLLVITTTVLAAFQPMFSFVGSGVTSDNLHNLLFTAVIFFCLKIISRRRLIDWLGLAVVLGLGIINKQQFGLAFLVVLPLIIYRRYFLVLPLSLLVAFIFAPERTKHLLSIFFSGRIPYLSPENNLVLPDYSLVKHVGWTIKHTIAEVLPWYWGVFNWLGVVLPRWINRVLMRLLAAAGAGLVIYFWKRRFKDIKVVFVAGAAIIYYLVLLVWDWNFTRQNGFPFGFQGRYYFPVLAAHMVLFTLGWQQLVSVVNRRWVRPALILLMLGFVFLQWQALVLVASSYYDLGSFPSFIIQASQYKPWFAKGSYLAVVIFGAAATNLGLVLKLRHAR